MHDRPRTSPPIAVSRARARTTTRLPSALESHARLHQLQFWALGDSATSPDADTFLSSLYSPSDQNFGSFSLPAYDKLYEKARTLPDGPERTHLYQEMARIIAAYAPWKINVHRIRTDMWYPQLVGYRKSPMAQYNFWKYVDIEPAAPGKP